MPSPIIDLSQLLRELEPVRNPGEFVYCPLPPGSALPPSTVMLFHESEGSSVIALRAEAELTGRIPTEVFAWITLRVHSSLAAVGLTAIISRTLADAGIGCNIVAALYHDHLFVPFARADEAMQHLRQLQSSAASARAKR